MVKLRKFTGENTTCSMCKVTYDAVLMWKSIVTGVEICNDCKNAIEEDYMEERAKR